MCHDAVVKARVKELKNLLDHNVFEVAWLSEVKSLTKARYKRLQDMKRSAVKARFVAQQVAYGKHDDVLASTTRLAVARTLWALAASRNSNSARYIGLRHSSTHTNRRAHCSHSACWDGPVKPKTLVGTRNLRNAQSVEDLGGRPPKSLEQRRVDLEQRVSKNVVPSQPNGHGEDFLVEAPLEGLGKAETTLRHHVETKRLAVVGPGRDSDERLLKRTIRWVEHIRSITWSDDPTQAEQPIHKCLDRA